MKYLIPILCFTLLLSEEKTEVIQRFPAGEKKIVVKYEGAGLDEKLIERYTFNMQGDIIRFEDFLNPDSYFTINPNLITGDGLKRHLKGNWRTVIEILDGKAKDDYEGIDIYIRFSDNAMEIFASNSKIDDYIYEKRQINYEKFGVIFLVKESKEITIRPINFNQAIIYNKEFPDGEFTIEKVYLIPNELIKRIDKMIEENEIEEEKREEEKNKTNKVNPDLQWCKEHNTFHDVSKEEYPCLKHKPY